MPSSGCAGHSREAAIGGKAEGKRRGPSRIPKDSVLHRWILPAGLVLMAVLTVGLIMVALGVVLRLIPWQ